MSRFFGLKWDQRIRILVKRKENNRLHQRVHPVEMERDLKGNFINLQNREDSENEPSSSRQSSSNEVILIYHKLLEI